MALFTGTQEKYYLRSQSFTGTGSQQDFILTEAAFGTGARPTLESEIKVFVNDVEIDKGNYTYPKVVVVMLTLLHLQVIQITPMN